MPDADAVRWYRGQGDRWTIVFGLAVLTAGFDWLLVMAAVATPAWRALYVTLAALVSCAGCVAVVLVLRAGIGVTAAHLIVRTSLGTRHLIAWPSVTGFDLKKEFSPHGGGGQTVVVVCKDGRRLHTQGCSFWGTAEWSLAAARYAVRALESERQTRTRQSVRP